MEIKEKPFDFELGEVLLVNKPIRWTSFDIVGKIKSCIGKKKLKIGHAGTLDPLAEGLLIICTGKKTKEIDSYQGLEKEYTGTLRFGATRPSFDLETQIDERFPFEHIDKASIELALKNFMGKIEQISPVYSARRIQGVRSYEMARSGQNIEIKPREVEIFDFQSLEFHLPDWSFKVRCSKGTYIRSLVRDLGSALNSGAYLSQLTRTSIGEYKLDQAWTLEDLCKKILDQKPDQVPIKPLHLEENRRIQQYWEDPN